MDGAWTDLDRQFGDRLREVRRSLGLTPTEFARRLGLSEIRIEQYERGEARLAAGELLAIARRLDLDVGFFFGEGGASAAPIAWVPEEVPGAAPSSRESLDLLRAFMQIASADERRRILRHVETLAGESDRFA